MEGSVGEILYRGQFNKPVGKLRRAAQAKETTAKVGKYLYVVFALAERTEAKIWDPKNNIHDRVSAVTIPTQMPALSLKLANQPPRETFCQRSNPAGDRELNNDGVISDSGELSRSCRFVSFSPELRWSLSRCESLQRSTRRL